MTATFELDAAELRLDLTNPRSARTVRHAVRKRLGEHAEVALVNLAGTKLTVGTLRNLTTELTHFVWKLRLQNRQLDFGFSGLQPETVSTVKRIAAEPLRQLQPVSCDLPSGAIVFSAGSWDQRHGERDRLVAMIARRDHSRMCAWCGADPNALSQGVTLDHLLPRTLGGSYEADNLIISCQACNSVRGHLCPRKWARRCRHESKQLNKDVVDAALTRYKQLKVEAELQVGTLPPMSVPGLSVAA